MEQAITEFKSAKENKQHRELKDALSGQRLKRQQDGIRDAKVDQLINKHHTTQWRVAQNRNQYFYEKQDNLLSLFKYGDYANDVVMAEILSFLLIRKVSPNQRLTFLNNANMNKISQALKSLLHDIESEMWNIQMEKERVGRWNGVKAENVSDN